MKRRFALLLISLVVVFPAASRAGEAGTDGLSAIPAEAMAFVYIPSVKAVDADYQDAVRNLGLQPFVPPAMSSLVGLLKAKLPMLEGMDEDGSLAMVLMPAPTPFELKTKTAVLVPAKQPKAMIEAMQGQAGEDGLWTVTMMGQPAYALVGKNRLIFASTPGVLKDIKESKAGIDSKLKPGEMKALQGLDLALWVDTDRLFKLVKPMVDGFMTSMMAMQASAGGFEAKSAEMNKKQIDMFMEGLGSLAVGISVDNSGVGLRFAMATKPGTELARQMSVKNTSGSLLGGLAAPKYMIAFGQIVEPAQTRASLEDLDIWYGMLEEVAEIESEKVQQLKGVINEALPMMTGLRGAVEALPPGPDGLIGLSILVDTTDSGKMIELMGKAIELGREMLADAAKKMEEDELEQWRGAIAYDQEAEEIGGAKVQHLELDLGKIEEIDKEDLEDLRKVIGKEGVLIRMAPVTAKTILIGFGGGKARTAAAIEQAKKKGTPLDGDAGIRKVAAHVPKERASVVYLAADRIIACTHTVTKALDEEDIPVHMPMIDAPLAMVGSGGDGSIQVDMFFPTELLVASKNAAMTVMGSQAGPPGETATAPPEKPAPVPDKP